MCACVCVCLLILLQETIKDKQTSYSIESAPMNCSTNGLNGGAMNGCVQQGSTSPKVSNDSGNEASSEDESNDDSNMAKPRTGVKTKSKQFTDASLINCIISHALCQAHSLA